MLNCGSAYLGILPIGNTWWNFPILLFFHCYLKYINHGVKILISYCIPTCYRKNQSNYLNTDTTTRNTQKNVKYKSNTFLFGECITGAGGDGGPRGIFLFVLRK